jgi:hypothetical protein
MMIEEENHNEDSSQKPTTIKGLNKALAILFVLGIYLVIFLKILFLD